MVVIFDKLRGLMEKRSSTPTDTTSNIQQVVSSGSPDAFTYLIDPNFVDEHQIMQIPTAKACVDIISNTIGSLPVYLYKQLPNGSVEKVEDDYRNNLLNREPNDYTNGTAFKIHMAKDLILYGSSFAVIERSFNDIQGLHPVLSRSVVVLKTIQNGYKTLSADIYLAQSQSGVVDKITKPNLIWKPHDLVIATKDSIDGLIGIGAIKRGQDIFRQAISEMKYTTNYFETGALPLAVLKPQDGINLTLQQRESLKQSWQSLYSGINNSAKTVLLPPGIDYEEIEREPVSGTGDLRKSFGEEICKVFNVPAGRVNSASGSQYQSSEQNNHTFLQDCLIPYITALEEAFYRNLLLEPEKEEGYFFRFDTSEILRANEKERIDSIKDAYTSGLFTINEARQKLNLPSIKEDFLPMVPGAPYLNINTGETKVYGAETAPQKQVNMNKQT